MDIVIFYRFFVTKTTDLNFLYFRAASLPRSQAKKEIEDLNGDGGLQLATKMNKS